MPPLSRIASLLASVLLAGTLFGGSVLSIPYAAREAAGPIVLLGMLVAFAVSRAASRAIERRWGERDDGEPIPLGPLSYVASLVLPIHFGLNELYLHLGDAVVWPGAAYLVFWQWRASEKRDG
jgi:hypothetical protein